MQRDIAPKEVTPQSGKGALGTWWFRGEGASGHRARGVQTLERNGSISKLERRGVHVSQHLSFLLFEKAYRD